MKTRTFPSFAALLIIVSLAVSGCSFDIAGLAGYLPFKKKTEAVRNSVYEGEKPVEKTADDIKEEVTREVNEKVDQMVEKINAGNWNEAIAIGENAFSVLEAGEKEYIEGVKAANKGATGAQSVREAVYLMETVKEKVVETLSEAYDYKNYMEGLSKEEKEKYRRVAMAHYSINVTEPFKKLALAKVMTDSGNLKDGLKYATEVYNSPERNVDATDTYAWALYLTGRKQEAYYIYKELYPKVETLLQLYHSAVVIEEYDKRLGLVLYRGCEKHGNNIKVKEPNVANLSAQSYINKIITDSQKANKRLLAGGFGVDSQYKMNEVQLFNTPQLVWK